MQLRDQRGRNVRVVDPYTAERRFRWEWLVAGGVVMMLAGLWWAIRRRRQLTEEMFEEIEPEDLEALEWEMGYEERSEPIG